MSHFGLIKKGVPISKGRSTKHSPISRGVHTVDSPCARVSSNSGLPSALSLIEGTGVRLLGGAVQGGSDNAYPLTLSLIEGVAFHDTPCNACEVSA